MATGVIWVFCIVASVFYWSCQAHLYVLYINFKLNKQECSFSLRALEA